ncbi:MAG: DUF4359 domain-containing protein [Flavobacteriales bacterium]
MKKIILILAVFLIAALAFTNPNEKDFGAFIKTELLSILGLTADSALVKQIAGDKLDQLSEGVASEFGERHNYFIFSVYEVDMGKEEMYFLGIANQFIPLQ